MYSQIYLTMFMKIWIEMEKLIGERRRITKGEVGKLLIFKNWPFYHDSCFLDTKLKNIFADDGIFHKLSILSPKQI